MTESLPHKHFKKTMQLARQLSKDEVYNWLMKYGYYPENYVLPPCFYMKSIPKIRKRYYKYTTNKFQLPTYEYTNIHFPKSSLTDRTFSIIEPTLYNDIAFEISENWKDILNIIFNSRNCVYSYSFPISIDSKNPGKTSKIRSGRMIYEFLEMAEKDLVCEAYRYKYLVNTDISNFYPSIYTHSIAWASHKKANIRLPANRNNYDYYGNRLDKLFQYANDSCTTGIPIGPAVSDLIAELVLSSIDINISKRLKASDGYLIVRFKDDYRILCKEEKQAVIAIKVLQEELKSYKLILNESKTEIKNLPEGLFRKWSGEYSKIQPQKSKIYTFKEFKNFYINVLEIEEKFPNTGLIDRFLSDLRDSKYNLYIPSTMKDLDRSISLLLMLADKRIKAFPAILGIIEAVLDKYNSIQFNSVIEEHLNNHLDMLAINTENNRYLICWILYFLKSKNLNIYNTYIFDDPIVKAVYKNSRKSIFNHVDFVIFRGIKTAAKNTKLIEYVDVFKQQL